MSDRTCRARVGRLTTLLLLAGAALSPAALSPTAQAQSAAPSDKTLVIARDMDVNSLDPSRGWCDTCQFYMGAVYQHLVSLGPDNVSFVPGLASRWDVNADQTQFTFHLNPKAVFSDGTPVHAQDLKWSWERLHNVKGGPSLFTNGIKSLATPDDETLVVTMDQPNSEFLARASHAYLVAYNSHLLQSHGGDAEPGADQKDTAEAWLLQHSVGSGPYMLDSYSPHDEIRLKRNPNYWGKPPYFAEVVIKQSKDAVSQGQMLQSGTADIAMQMDMTSAQSIVGDKIEITRAPSYSDIYVALSPGAKNLPVPLSLKLRQAIGYAIDYKSLLDFAVDGAGRLQPSPIPNGFPGTQDLPAPVYDPAKARALLAEAGLANGLKLEALYPNLNTFGIDLSLVMQAIQRDLAKVKIDLDLHPATFPVWRDHLQGDGIPFTVGFYTPGYVGSGVYVQYFSMMPGAVWAKRAGVERDPSIATPAVSDLYKRALATDGAARADLYHQIALQMIQDRIILPLINPDILIVHRKGLLGLHASVCCMLALDEIHE